MRKSTDAEIALVGAAIAATAVQQGLAGLRLMPHMLPEIERMALGGDEYAAAVVAAYKAEMGGKS